MSLCLLDLKRANRLIIFHVSEILVKAKGTKHLLHEQGVTVLISFLESNVRTHKKIFQKEYNSWTQQSYF